MKNTTKTIEASKKALSRYLSETYQDFEHEEMERSHLGFSETLVLRRGKINCDIGIYRYAQVVCETYDGSGDFLPQSPALSFQDRVDVLLGFIVSLNSNARRRTEIDLGAFDILNQLSATISADDLSAHDEPPPINESGSRVNLDQIWTPFMEARNGEKAVHGGADHWASAAR